MLENDLSQNPKVLGSGKIRTRDNNFSWKITVLKLLKYILNFFSRSAFKSPWSAVNPKVAGSSPPGIKIFGFCDRLFCITFFRFHFIILYILSKLYENAKKLTWDHLPTRREHIPAIGNNLFLFSWNIEEILLYQGITVKTVMNGVLSNGYLRILSLKK